MNILFSVDYQTKWGENLYICGSIPELGCFEEHHALKMSYVSASRWQIEVNLSGEATDIEYYYFVKGQDGVLCKEGCIRHNLSVNKGYSYCVEDKWLDEPTQKHLYSSAFTDSFFYHPVETVDLQKDSILLKVKSPYVERNQSLLICGASDLLGNWDEKKALPLSYAGNGEWQITINARCVQSKTEYKFAIYDNRLQHSVYWTEGENLVLYPFDAGKYNVRVETYLFSHPDLYWRTSGIAIPVFSLRSRDSFGIGEFSDLRKMIDWAAHVGMTVIQVLPINDTTVSGSWRDSYPYSAISIYALHPIYLGLKDYPLKDNAAYTRYESWAAELNKRKDIDYEAVLRLKQSYLKELFAEIGDNVLNSEAYKTFYKRNEEWLFPYACFCYLRDKYGTTDYTYWQEYNTYDRDKLGRLVDSDKEILHSLNFVYFTQYLLDKQLKEVKDYAHQKDVILKGDIPIGVNRLSVDAWTEPHLFNLDMQAGAPPDDFSANGQNWGFPTYNWHEMAKDNYEWWVKRFRKMADYFDAYRIDHILGFFRIWEIPKSSVQGLLGYFSPALPYSLEELAKYGFTFDDIRMTSPYICSGQLSELFGEYKQEVIEKYLNLLPSGCYALKENCDTQTKIQELFAGQQDGKANYIREGLFQLCNEVLFVRDKYHPHLLHPRILAQQSYSYKHLDQKSQESFDWLYHDFFYRRHSLFWADNAMKKLPTLISSTRMLVCGEDLGMIPECVPSVMHQLQIFSLEIERMPKEMYQSFANLSKLPYLSVCTTSTHDMSPIRLWWREEKDLMQRYYNEILRQEGEVPEDCSAELCRQILINNLNSPSMFAIIPFQDWLSVSDKYKRVDFQNERINVPADPKHYWRYRMHLNLEDLIESPDLNEEIKNILITANRLND